MNKNFQNPVERIIYLMQTDDSVDAPQDALRWSKNIFKTRAVEKQKSFTEKVLAVLKIDLTPGKAAFGERSGSTGAARQMLFEAGENSIDLRIEKRENGFEIRGQILGSGFENSVVKLGDLTAKTNDLSEFRFDDVEPGEYRLIVAGAKTIELEGLIIG